MIDEAVFMVFLSRPEAMAGSFCSIVAAMIPLAWLHKKEGAEGTLQEPKRLFLLIAGGKRFLSLLSHKIRWSYLAKTINLLIHSFIFPLPIQSLISSTIPVVTKIRRSHLFILFPVQNEYDEPQSPAYTVFQ